VLLARAVADVSTMTACVVSSVEASDCLLYEWQQHCALYQFESLMNNLCAMRCIFHTTGDTCSYARECNGADACAAIEGYQWMVDSVTALLNSSAPVSPHLLHLLQVSVQVICCASFCVVGLNQLCIVVSVL
jgi:hypothetical protein